LTEKYGKAPVLKPFHSSSLRHVTIRQTNLNLAESTMREEMSAALNDRAPECSDRIKTW